MKKGEPLQKKATSRLDALKDFVKLMPESVNSRYFNRGTNKGPPIVHLTFKGEINSSFVHGTTSLYFKESVVSVTAQSKGSKRLILRSPFLEML